MGRLIDADALLDAMDKRYNEKKDIVPNNLAEGFMQMEKLIKEQPTAYDVSRVVAELKAASDVDDIDDVVCIRENKAIDIVRKGGVE